MNLSRRNFTNSELLARKREREEAETIVVPTEALEHPVIGPRIKWALENLENPPASPAPNPLALLHECLRYWDAHQCK